MTPDDLRKVAAKLPLSQSVLKRNLGGGGLCGSGTLLPQPEAVVAQSATPVKKRIRQDTKPLMNKLEMEYFHCLMKTFPDGCKVLPQAMRFRLANGLWFKVDFIVSGYHGLYGYEVKGPHAFRGGFENLKMAATTYPWIKWFLVWKDGGIWQEQEVLP